MRSFVALMLSAVTLVCGWLALDMAASETSVSSSSNAQEVEGIIQDLSLGFSEPLAAALPWLALSALILVGGGVLVSASRGGR